MRVPHLPFVVAVALLAAAIGDPLVESISNSGVFGHGYADNNHLSVIPALVAGAALLLALVCTRCLHLLRHAPRDRNWLLQTAREMSPKSPLRELPYVLLLAFAALFVMETAEQLVLGGQLAGTAAWLGGPIWFSILAHALICCVCTLLVARAMRAAVSSCAALVASVLSIVFMAPDTSGIYSRRTRDASSGRFQPVHVRAAGERAPPFLSVSA